MNPSNNPLFLSRVEANAREVADLPVPGGPKIQPRTPLLMTLSRKNLNCS
jgi:hypothetical protein